MSKYLRVLIAIILVSLLVATIILPIDYLNITISELGLFMDNPILHGVLAMSIFGGGSIVLIWWSIEEKRITSLICVAFIIVFWITDIPILEWIAFWMLCEWTIMRLIKND